MTKYKLISNADTVKAGGVLFTWKKATQETLAKAYAMGLTDHVELISDKVEINGKKFEKVSKKKAKKNKK